MHSYVAELLPKLDLHVGSYDGVELISLPVERRTDRLERFRVRPARGEPTCDRAVSHARVQARESPLSGGLASERGPPRPGPLCRFCARLRFAFERVVQCWPPEDDCASLRNRRISCMSAGVSVRSNGGGS